MTCLFSSHSCIGKVKGDLDGVVIILIFVWDIDHIIHSGINGVGNIYDR